MVKRYSLSTESRVVNGVPISRSKMRESPFGEYILYSDYKVVIDKIAKLLEIVEKGLEIGDSGV